MPKPTDLVHAKYLGGTTVVMPELAGRDRCCQEHNQREYIPVDPEDPQLNPHTILQHGDVILLDRFSAEGRADFEIVDASALREPHRCGRGPWSSCRPCWLRDRQETGAWGCSTVDCRTCDRRRVHRGSGRWSAPTRRGGLERSRLATSPVHTPHGADWPATASTRRDRGHRRVTRSARPGPTSPADARSPWRCHHCLQGPQRP